MVLWEKEVRFSNISGWTNARIIFRRPYQIIYFQFLNLILFHFGGESHPAGSVLTLGSGLREHISRNSRELNRVSEVEPRVATYKASTLPTILSLWPLPLLV